MKKYIMLAAVVFIAASAGIATAHFGQFSGDKDKMIERHAEILGLDPEEVKAELEDGKTFKEIISESGYSKEEIIEKKKAFWTEKINDLLESNEITQEQADKKLEWLDNMKEKKFFHHGGYKNWRHKQIEEQ